jgi:hypothetical protein
MKNAYLFLETLKGRDLLEYINRDRRIIFKWFLEKQVVRL